MDGTHYNKEEKTMSNNIKNIKKAVGNTVSAATGIVTVGTEVVADGSGLISNSIGAAPAVLKALLSTPFTAAKGYLMEAEDMTAQEAEAVAFHYIEQDVATTITEAGEGAGKLVAKLFDEDEESITTSEQKGVNNQ